MTAIASLLAALVIAPPFLFLPPAQQAGDLGAVMKAVEFAVASHSGRPSEVRLSRIEVVAGSGYPAERFDALRRQIPFPVAPLADRVVCRPLAPELGPQPRVCRIRDPEKDHATYVSVDIEELQGRDARIFVFVEYELNERMVSCGVNLQLRRAAREWEVAEVLSRGCAH